MTMDSTDQKIKDLEKRVKFFEDVFLGISNNVTVRNKVRAMVITGEHTTNKPTIENSNGKRYKLQVV